MIFRLVLKPKSVFKTHSCCALGIPAGSQNTEKLIIYLQQAEKQTKKVNSMSWKRKEFEVQRVAYKDLPFVNRHGRAFVFTVTATAFLILFSRPIYDAYVYFGQSDAKKRLKSYEDLVVKGED